ncbi:hypothetical protein [Natronorubrum thiooxidans]|uniref:hypothetical protein n=1 Tax=Natronorubrum thiooxidans TaxID=308853 RepID=UPI00373FD18E
MCGGSRDGVSRHHENRRFSNDTAFDTTCSLVRNVPLSRSDSAWKCRWDRHPNAHNSRDHFHPPPTAIRTDAKNAQWPDDHLDVSRLVLDRIEERIEMLWK